MDSTAEEFRAKLHSTPHDQKWQLLRPQIEQLYIEEGRQLCDVIDEIDQRWNFKASYVYHTAQSFLPCPEHLNVDA